MRSKRERQADRALVAAYHEARLLELVDHAAEAVDRLRAGENDAYDVDEVLRQYSCAARELWKFCWLGGRSAGVERTARLPRAWSPRATPSTGGSSALQGTDAVRERPAALHPPLAPETRPENPPPS